MKKELEWFGDALKENIKSHLKMVKHLVFMIVKVNLIQGQSG